MEVNGSKCEKGGMRVGGNERGKCGDGINKGNRILGGALGKRKVRYDVSVG